MEMEFTRQNRIFNPSKCDLNITIVGVGSTGSFLAFTLAKMGIKNIKVIDYDIVEAHNIPNQYYRLSDLGKPKVEALKEIVRDFSGVELIAENIKVTEDYDFDIDLNSLVIFCVDNIEARKLIFDKIRGFPIKLIDTRFGGEGFSVHIAELDKEEDCEKFEKSLNVPIKETGCGEKSIIYTINGLASEVCAIVKKINDKTSIPKLMRREMKTFKFIAGGFTENEN